MKPYLIQNLTSNLGKTANSRMIVPQNSADRVLEVEGTEVTIRPEADVTYQCGEVSALSLTDCPETGSFSVIFTSGATASVVSVPAGIVMPEDFQIEANTRYEINVRNGYALCAGWAVSE